MKILTISILFFSFNILAQYDVNDVKNDSVSPKKINPFKLKEKIYVGSGINLLIGNVSLAYVSPIIGYDILPSLSAGVGTMFQFYTNGGSTQLSTGFGVFTRYRPIDQLILETSFNTYTTKVTGFTEKFKAKSWMLGLGYARPLGERSYYQFMLQYDLLRNLNVPEPVIIHFTNSRLYYKFGFVFYLSNN